MTNQVARVWSAFQEAIFSLILSFVPALVARKPLSAGESRNLVVLARAGCAKTSTAVEVVSRLPNTLRILMCAFNKSIARELGDRLNAEHIHSRTLNSIGFSVVRKRFPNIKVDAEKTQAHAYAALTAGGFLNEFGAVDGTDVSMVCKLVSLAKSQLAAGREDVARIAEEFRLGDADSRLSSRALVDVACDTLNRCIDDVARIDLDDQVFFPYYFNIFCAWYDVVVVDEAQDMTPAQLSLARRLCRKTGSIIVIGDDRQAIYGWRGADKGAMSRMARELNAPVLTLPVSYRCPRVVVQAVQPIVPDFQAAPNALEGAIEHTNSDNLLSMLRPGDVVISRKNAPLMPMCLQLLAAGIPATVKGRDVAAKLASLVKRAKGKTVDEMLSWLTRWSEKEVARLTRTQAPASKVDEVSDTVAAILAIAAVCKTKADVLARIDAMFSADDSLDSEAARNRFVVLTSTHKGKGLEWQNVAVLADTYFLKNGDRAEEENLWYVALTRTQKTLRVVSDKTGTWEAIDARISGARATA